MRFSVEQWAPDYGASFDADGRPGQAPAGRIDEGTEVPADRWAPIRPDPATTPMPETVAFVDGVQRIDARVWLESGAGSRLGLCASYAAGIVRCSASAEPARATIERDDVVVGRGVFSPVAEEPIRTGRVAYEPRAAVGDTVDLLRHAVQQAMLDLEAGLAARVGESGLVVLDGSIRAGSGVPAAIGFIKTHHVRYLSEATEPAVARLAPGERTPVFLMETSWLRYSWYVRLPYGEGHDWAGIVRCEAPKELDKRAVVALADRSAVALPRYASRPHKDPRAPQNLYPIGGLERTLRRRLGDPAFLYRELRAAAARNGGAPGAAAADASGR